MIFKSALAVLAVSTEGFVVTRPSLLPGTSCLAGDKPYFATQSKEEDISEEEEVEMLVEQEIKKTKRISNLRNANGVDYAPWMGISKEDEEQIRQIMKERTAARRARKEQETNVSGNLYFDSQAQELSGTGLNYNIMDGAVELEWATKSETNTLGFDVKRRPAKTDEFKTIASFKEYPPLNSKGVDGGIYRFLDETVAPGGWVYRVTEVDNDGSSSDICQCLVEVQTESEQRAAVIAAATITLLAIAAFVAGVALDPLQ